MKSVGRAVTPAPVPLTGPTDRPLAAIGLLLVGMFLFTACDGAAKYLSASLAAQQIIWVRYLVVAALLVPVLWYRRASRPLATTQTRLHLLRGVLLVASAIIYVLAVQGMPLELAAAIGFVSPLYVTALSIPLLGEKVGVRRWAAVAIGFLGVLVIIRPGSASFQWSMLLPLLSSFCWALALILTRRMRASEQALTILAWSSLVGLLACAPLAIPVWQAPQPTEWAILVAVGLFNALAQYLVIHAFMMGSASMLAPFSYSTILWAVLIGALVFGTFPDPATIAGTAVLVAAGLYVWHRERVRHTPPTVPGAYLAEAAEAVDAAEDERA